MAIVVDAIMVDAIMVHAIGSSGGELAARPSAGLGRTIAYLAEPLDVFERGVDAAMGPGMGARIDSKFR